MKKPKKTNQRELLFYLLYKEFKTAKVENRDPEFIPLWRFMGEVYISELNEWSFMSYEVSTTMSKLKADETLLFESRDYKLKNGGTALAYRLRPEIKFADIKTKEIQDFYTKIRKIIFKYENQQVKQVS